MVGVDTSFLVALEVQEHPHHRKAWALLQEHVIDASQPFGLAPQVITEFLHVVTDSRRFSRPLSMAEALRQARDWWNANQTHRIYPSDESTELFLKWMNDYQLGRKRLLDTQLAAIYRVADVSHIATLNSADFSVFGVFEFLAP